MNQFPILISMAFILLAAGCNNANEKNADWETRTEPDGTRTSVQKNPDVETTYTSAAEATVQELKRPTKSGYTYDPTNGTTSNGVYRVKQ